MTRFLSLCVFLSFLLIQIHGFSHAVAGENDNNHNCPVCKIQSHHPGLISSDQNLDLHSPVVTKEKELSFRREFVKLIIFENINSRGPPIG